jgi:hypothetical protein
VKCVFCAVRVFTESVSSPREASRAVTCAKREGILSET